MPRKVVSATPHPTGDKICSFCGLKDENDLEYGKLHEYDGIVTHYYCLLLSSNMQQRGRDDEGILGFLTEDINKELRRGKRLACCYCKKSGATLGCCNTKCKRIFHFPCGLRSGSLHQFFGEFKSYCKTHRPAQKIDERVSQEVKDRDTMICYICYDDVNPRDMLGTLWAPCCKKNAWFHRTCVQQLAMSAGYFFKCPLCNNKTEFQKAMLDHGIFIPSQDASWELVPNAFEELLYRHNRCDAHKCLCPKGREHVSTNAKWELTLCRTCGSQGIHMACGNLKWVKPVWECNECTSILNKSVTSHSDLMSLEESCREDRSPRIDSALLTDDESSDSDISVGGLADIRVPIAIKQHTDTRENFEENCVATLRGRRYSYARSVSPTEHVTTDHDPTKSLHTDDVLPPVPKKPRISESVVNAREPVAADSDDDIIVISGPSRKEQTVVSPNGVAIPINGFQRFFSDTQSDESSTKVEPQSPMSVHQQDIRKIQKIETPPKLPSDTSTKDTEIRVMKRPSSGTVRPPPVEIDLSEAEVTVPESLSTVETNHTASSFSDTPELNIKISNVTSLAPEAFDLVPETINQDMVASNNYTATNVGLTSEDPIILDEKSAPKESQNNNMLYNSTHDQLKIVRFNGAENITHSQANSVIYGLTIPGTNHTVPFIVSPPDNCKSKTPGIHPDPNNPLGIALCDCNSSRPSSFTDILNLNVFNPTTNDSTLNLPTPKTAASPNVTRKVENASGASSTAVSTKQNIERRSAPQSIDPKMWSVPLKFIVKGTVTKTHSPAKSSSNITNNSTYSNHYSSFSKSNGSSILPRKPVTAQAKPIVQNGTGSSSTSVSQGKTTKSLKPASVAQTKAPKKHFPILPKKLFQASQTKAAPPNRLVSPATSQSTKTVPNPKSVQSVNNVKTISNVENVSTGSMVWAKVNGSYVPIDPATVKDIVHTTSPESTKLQSQKSLTSENIQPMFHFVAPEQKDKNDSSKNCDGDAGSDPAVQPTFVNSTNARHGRPQNTAATSSRHVDATYDEREQCDADGTDERRCGDQKDVTAECSASFDGRYSCDRTGLIHKTIDLRDIKFTIGGPNIVKMTLYETYNVNIKVDTTSRCKYDESKDAPDMTTFSSTNRSSPFREDQISSIIDSDSTDTAVSLTNDCSNNAIGSDHDSALNQSESTLENNVAIAESVANRAQSDAGSHGQDELKENRDPIPPSGNSPSTTSVAERKSKTRSRPGVNDNSMRSLNEKKAQEAISEKIETSTNKCVANDTQLGVNQTKVYYNGCKDANEARPLVTSIETVIKNPISTRGPINDGNAEIIEQFEAAKRRRMLIKVGQSSDTRESKKLTTTDESKNYGCTKIKSQASNLSVAEIAEQFAAAQRRRMSAKDGNFRETENRGQSKTIDESKNYNFTKINPTNSSNLSAAEILQQFAAAKKRRISTTNDNSNETQESTKLLATKINPLVNDVAKYKRKWSETNHVCLTEKIHVNNTLHNGEIATNGESLCCKVSIDLTRIREVLATKLNVSKDAKFQKGNNEYPANDTAIFKHKTVFSRSRSFENLTEHVRRPVENRSSRVELQRSKSFDNLNSLTLRYRYANGAIGIEDGGRRRGSKRKIKNFENHDCVR